MSFRDRFASLIQELENSDLTVLIWGPGEGAKGYHKREQIRDAVRVAFPRADVRFSEELGDDLAALLAGASTDLSIDEQELWHIGASDVCVVLDMSIGAASEVARYCRTLHAYKFLILTSEEYKGAPSYASSLRAHLNQVFFTEHEFASCSLVERVLTRVRQVALARRTNLPA